MYHEANVKILQYLETQFESLHPSYIAWYYSLYGANADFGSG